MNEFDLKDNGQRQEFAGGMVREPQADKLRYDLAFDGPMFWMLFKTGRFAKVVAAAETWYVWGGVDNALQLMLELAAVEGITHWELVDRYTVLMMKGAIKYSDRNWLRATGDEELKRFIASFSRHFVKYLRGETDEDHLAAIFFNVNGAEYLRDKMSPTGDEIPF